MAIAELIYLKTAYMGWGHIYGKISKDILKDTQIVLFAFRCIPRAVLSIKHMNRNIHRKYEHKNYRSCILPHISLSVLYPKGYIPRFFFPYLFTADKKCACVSDGSHCMVGAQLSLPAVNTCLKSKPKPPARGTVFRQNLSYFNFGSDMFIGYSRQTFHTSSLVHFFQRHTFSEVTEYLNRASWTLELVLCILCHYWECTRMQLGNFCILLSAREYYPLT